MAGGGIQGGRVVGSSDKEAAEPKDNPKIVQDVLAILICFGLVGWLLA